MAKQKLNLKHRPKVWVGAGKDSLPPRKYPNGQKRKPKNMKWEVTAEVLEKIEQLSAQGMNKEQICYALDIGRETLRRRETENPLVGEAIGEAIKKGRSKGIAIVTNRLFLDAQQPGRLGAQAFLLKNIAGFKDHATTEVTGAGGEPLIPRREYSDEERVIRIASILAAARERRAGKLTIAKKRRN